MTTLLQHSFKSGVALIDLSAAYTVHGPLIMTAKLRHCHATVRVLASMLGNHDFRILLVDTTSAPRTLNDGHPQGSVLAPILFNILLRAGVG